MSRKKKYRFNEHGCCLNPDVELIHDANHSKAEIELAFRDGLWYYGYGFECRNSSHRYGGSGACANKYRTGYKTKEEARAEALKKGIRMFQEEKIHAGVSSLMLALQPQASLF